MHMPKPTVLPVSVWMQSIVRKHMRDNNLHGEYTTRLSNAILFKSIESHEWASVFSFITQTLERIYSVQREAGTAERQLYRIFATDEDETLTDNDTATAVLAVFTHTTQRKQVHAIQRQQWKNR